MTVPVEPAGRSPLAPFDEVEVTRGRMDRREQNLWSSGTRYRGPPRKSGDPDLTLTV
jgi:hypothetical protein